MDTCTPRNRGRTLSMTVALDKLDNVVAQAVESLSYGCNFCLPLLFKHDHEFFCFVFLDVFCSFMVKVLFCDILHTSSLSFLTIEGEVILNWDSNTAIFFEACIMMSTDPGSRKKLPLCINIFPDQFSLPL